MPACPAKVGRVVLMPRITDGVEEFGVGPCAADILGRAGAGSVDAFSMARRGIEGQPFFDTDHMGPVIPKIIKIGEGQILTSKVRKPDLGIVEVRGPPKPSSSWPGSP